METGVGERGRDLTFAFGGLFPNFVDSVIFVYPFNQFETSQAVCVCAFIQHPNIVALLA